METSLPTDSTVKSVIVVLGSIPIGLAVILLVWLAKVWIVPVPTRPTRNVVLLVLGDLGRSPRMMYHAKSFADHGFQTTLVGFSEKGSNILPSLLSLPNFQSIVLPNPPKILTKAPRSAFLVVGPLKVLFQLVSILEVLLWKLEDPPEFIFVQNPPSIPTLAIAQLVCLVRGSKLIIDWHNLGYSILALKLGPDHTLVKIAKMFERIFGKNAYAHLFVTKAMRDWACKEWNLQGKKAVLHDRPPEHFHSCDPAETHDLFTRLFPTFPSNLKSFLPSTSLPRSTPLTDLQSPSTLSRTSASSFASVDPIPVFRGDRPAVLISSTSWTPDEDFSILLEALSLYEQTAREEGKGERRLPKVVMVISGKGPGRAQFEKEVAERKESEGWEFVRVWCCWVHVEDYPKLLGSADLGISLHSSSSALDLPMKIVDMFGCGLPVCSLNFACLSELVRDGQNGYVFSTASELASRLSELLRDFPSSAQSTGRLSEFRQVIQGDQRRLGSWSSNWDRVVRPLVIKGTAGGVEVLSEA
ncbi:Beta-1,4-mannosyltransferase [Phaffia rhodozyma]|uniref:Chitobiosyldiphosphodolichol beta-mannosyltransferase n=1 Tax=Phaffia rhodozyma TaxID=264483 RepID=A0A0F7SU61_PHARH|nr:Beta-1,4-mannosyltransferase [Phaffia rhodozyma]